MINTIFWFANDYNDYERERDGQGISDKTIVFVKETGEIYINNRKYGKTLQDIVNDPEMTDIFKDSALKEEIQSMIDLLEDKHDGDISRLEGIISSNKDTQDGDKEELNGRIDGIQDQVTTILNRTTIARGGSNISQVGTPTVTVSTEDNGNKTVFTFNYLKGEPGTPGSTGAKGDKGDKGDKGNPGNDGHSPTVEIRNGYWYIDGVNTGVKAKGEDGATPTVNPYDDTEIRGKIQEILDELEDLQNNPGGSSGSGLTAEDLARIEELESNVGELQRTVDALELSSGGMTENEINSFIENAISNSTTLLELIREHGIDGIASWSGWDNKLQSYLQGYVAGQYTDENGSYNITLSELVQKVNLLKSLVDAVSVLVDENGQPISLEAIQTMINQSIEGNTSISEIKNKYAFKKDDVMKWMGSGFESSVSPTTSFSQMYANGLSTVNGNITSATSGLRSEITNDTNGLVSGAISTLVSNYSNGDITTLSGLVAKANNSISEADMVASINDSTSQAHSAVKATADASFVTNFASYKSDVEHISSISNKADATSAAISGIVDASTNTVTASKIWSTLASNESVKSAMKSEFATTVDGEGVASIVKEDIAQDFEQSSWDAYVGYMKGGIASITGLTNTVNANQAIMESFAAYATDLDTLKNDQSHITALSIASKIANSTEAVNTLSAKFKPTSQEIATAVETLLNASANGGDWTSFAQQIASDHTSLGSLSTRVGTLEGKDFVESAMFALITDVNGNINGASIIAAVNSDGSSVTIDADKIDIGGVTILPNQVKDSNGNTLPNIITTAIAASTIKASQITSGKITASQIDATNLHVSAANVDGNITANALSIKNNNNVVVSAMNSDGSGWIGNDGTSKGMTWNTTGGITLNNTFLQSLATALANGVTNNETVKGYGVEVSMPGTKIPPMLTVLGMERQLITVDASHINYYDFVTDSSQYPYNGNVAEKRAWIENAVNGWRLVFISGILQGKQSIDVYSNKTFDLLTASELDSRVNYVHKYTNAELAAIVGKDESRYVGVHTRSEILNNSIEASVGDWCLVLFALTGADPDLLKTIYQVMVKVSSGWGREIENEFTTLYSQSNP